jgi:hypothetical protein
MAEHRACGHLGWLVQYKAPVWQPLVVAVGQRLADTFMWMHEEELDDGSVLHAYKHIHTRRYLYLTTDGRAFEHASCGGFVPMRLDHAIEQALCTWSILSGWDAQYAEAVRDAVLRACEQVSGGA